jgi:two-component system, OmpR family, sensor histidine kinase QseC
MTQQLNSYSLRTKLVVMLLLSMVSVMAGVGVLGYQLAQHEAEEIFDAQMAEMAQVLLSEPFSERNSVVNRVTLGAHPYQQHIAYQVWRDDKLLLTSVSVVTDRLATLTGYSNGQINGEPWHFFVAKNPNTEETVITAQKIKVRDELAEELAWRLVLPIAAGILALGLITWLVVTSALRPLTDIANQVNARATDRLSPVALEQAAPRELLPLLNALNALFERVETSLDSERRFTADAAHELRTPLAAMRLQAQLASEAPNMEARKIAIENMGRDATRASRLVEQLLTLARADTLSRKPINTTVDAAQQAFEVCASLQILALAKEQNLIVDAPHPVVIQADTELLRALISNLTSNALNYSPKGAHITIKISAESIAVIDDGPGMSIEERGQAMHRFVRLHEGDVPGSGLGLSIAERVSHALSCTLEFDETPGGGLTARCRF